MSKDKTEKKEKSNIPQMEQELEKQININKIIELIKESIFSYDEDSIIYLFDIPNFKYDQKTYEREHKNGLLLYPKLNHQARKFP